jgi:hypothetical protein
VLSAYGEPSFETFVARYVMPATTAYRYMAVARESPEVLAFRLGIEKTSTKTSSSPEFAKRSARR